MKQNNEKSIVYILTYSTMPELVKNDLASEDKAASEKIKKFHLHLLYIY